jgi:hypothetical protein
LLLYVWKRKEEKKGGKEKKIGKIKRDWSDIQGKGRDDAVIPHTKNTRQQDEKAKKNTTRHE